MICPWICFPGMYQKVLIIATAQPKLVTLETVPCFSLSSADTFSFHNVTFIFCHNSQPFILQKSFQASSLVQNQMVSSQIPSNVINTMNVLMKSQIQDSVLMDCCLKLQTQIMSFVIILSMLTAEPENMSVS